MLRLLASVAAVFSVVWLIAALSVAPEPPPDAKAPAAPDVGADAPPDAPERDDGILSDGLPATWALPPREEIPPPREAEPADEHEAAGEGLLGGLLG